MERKQYICPKCGCRTYEHDQFQATGGNFAKIFDVQNKKFITISCTQCGYTELYNCLLYTSNRAANRNWCVLGG